MDAAAADVAGGRGQARAALQLRCAGPLDYRRLIALFLRKIACIVVFINTGAPLDFDYDFETRLRPSISTRRCRRISDIRSRDNSKITCF